MAHQLQDFEPQPVSGYGPSHGEPQGLPSDSISTGKAFERNTRSGNSSFLEYHTGEARAHLYRPVQSGLGEGPPTHQDVQLTDIEAPRALRPPRAAGRTGSIEWGA